MHWDKRKLLIGIGFLIVMILCMINWITKGYSSYNVFGTFLFAFIGIGFIRFGRNK